MLRRAHAVTAVTEGVRDALLAKGVDPERLVWLPNGADTTMFHPGPPDRDCAQRLGADDSTHVFLYAGTHGYVHGMEVLLDAAALLRDDPVRFVLVGDGSEKAALQARAAESRLDNVVFLDPVDPAEVAQMLRCATGALASVRAGDVYRTIRSAKAVPAMASGCPVVYSGDDEGSRLVARIGAGLATAPGDPDAVAGAVRQLVADPALRRQLGEQGRSWVMEHASWTRLVGDWLDQLATIEERSPSRDTTEVTQ
jgi:glycosyltransferase involved in cell wall biosynthesis